MITTVVGRTFLNAYNIKYKKQLTPKEFFVEVFHSLFYNHNKYLMPGGNSPLENPKLSWEKMAKGFISYESSDQRDERLLKFLNKAEEANGIVDASIAMGYPASEITSATSGMVSDIIIPTNEDEIYLSWIGGGLGIGVAGGYTILFDDALITLQTFEGWKVYRKFMNDRTLEKLRGNQIGTWNGQWLSYSLDQNKFQEDFDFGILTDEKIFSIDSEKIEVNTINWSKLFFSLSQLYPNKSLMAYFYGFGQTNKTIGFIPFQLKSGTKLKQIYKQLTVVESSLSTKDFESLFGMHIKRACELGSIGLHALRPDGLVKYMNENKNISFKNDDDKVNYFIYKTWLIAMMSKNKEEVTEYTLELARTILRYRNSGTKNDRKNLVEKELFEAKSKKGFIEHLTTMVKDLDEQDLSQIKNLKDEIHLMTNEEFGYFSTLLKFDYAYLEKQS
jgi:hypothetical protein